MLFVCIDVSGTGFSITEQGPDGNDKDVSPSCKFPELPHKYPFFQKNKNQSKREVLAIDDSFLGVDFRLQSLHSSIHRRKRRWSTAGNRKYRRQKRTLIEMEWKFQTNEIRFMDPISDFIDILHCRPSNFTRRFLVRSPSAISRTRWSFRASRLCW